MAPLGDLLDDLLTRCTFPAAGTDVACALSGGADSLALTQLAVHAGCRVTAIHVDHGLRPESVVEAEVVAGLAEHLEVPLERRTLRLDPGPNLEARARAARYAVLPHGVLTGHTADDQAETVLLHLLRGSVGGLAGMRPGDGRVVRPILNLRRAETEAVCAAAGLTPIVDSSNRDLTLRRNAVRHRVLPLLSAIAERDLVPILTRQADLIGDESDFLDRLAATLDPTDAKALTAAPVVLARRAVRRWLTAEHPPDAATIERVLAVARGEAVACETVDGRRVSRSHQKLSVRGPSTDRAQR